MLIGSVARNATRFVVSPAVVWMAGAFDTASHARGTSSASVKRALRSGWSKQGNTVLASDGTKSE